VPYKPNANDRSERMPNENNTVTIGMECDGFTIWYGEDGHYYHFSQEFDERSYQNLKEFIEAVTNDEVEVVLEEVY
jgi:hypothetical protein